MARKTDNEQRLEASEALQRELRPDETVLGRLGFLRWIQQSPWDHSGFTKDPNGEICVGAFFPRTAEADDWEVRAISMHENQKPVEMPTEPLERKRLRGGAIAEFNVVGIDDSSSESSVVDLDVDRAKRTKKPVLKVYPKFHETSPISTELQRRRTKRGN